MLQISHLGKTYANGVRALHDINLTLGTGMFGLLGPNGAGKSSLMRTIATLQDADSGTIRFDGVDIAADPAFLRARLGYLPQDFGVYPKISANDLLDHMAVLKGIISQVQRKEQVANLLHLTNLHEHRHRAVSSFSGGMRQRFGIAQALLGDPRLIVVDEPTAGLDPQERHRFHDLLSEIGQNVVVILSTHIVDDVLDLCSNMAILAAGMVQCQGVPADLVARLEGRVWERCIDRAELPACQEKYKPISSRLLAGRLRIRVLADALPGAGFEPAAASLEDVYFSVLKEVSGAQEGVNRR